MSFKVALRTVYVNEEALISLYASVALKIFQGRLGRGERRGGLQRGSTEGKGGQLRHNRGQRQGIPERRKQDSTKDRPPDTGEEERTETKREGLRYRPEPATTLVTSNLTE